MSLMDIFYLEHGAGPELIRLLKGTFWTLMKDKSENPSLSLLLTDVRIKPTAEIYFDFKILKTHIVCVCNPESLDIILLFSRFSL